MKKISPLLALPIFLLFISACGLYRDKGYKQVSYYQDVNRSDITQEEIKNYKPFKIQPGDILGINVNSLNPEAASVFNTSSVRVSGNNPDISSTNSINGFEVGANGEVQLPLVGNMKVNGLTTDEVAKQLTANLEEYLKGPIVNIRILNFKISVLGDVIKPGVYTIQNEHVNVNEALSLAGDLNITAKRTNVLLIREENGQRQFVTLDLTKKDIFDSPYYYLHNNDVIYVDPGKTKYDSVARSYKTNTVVISSTLAILAILASAFFVYHR